MTSSALTRRALLASAFTLAVAPLPRPAGASYEQQLRAFAAADEEARSPDGALLFVGSSTIRLWPDLAATFAPRPVVTRGFGGARLADVVEARTLLFGPHRPSAVILYAGENDLADGVPTATVLEHFIELRRALSGTPAGRAPLIFIELKPTPARFGLWPAMRAVNAAIDALGVPLRPDAIVNTSGFILKNDGSPDPALFAPDGVHLNARGYAHLTASTELALAPLTG